MREDMIARVRNHGPMIHCITNYVTAGYMADMVLAIGGSPIMADGILEVEEVTGICDGLVINLGTLNERSVAAMKKAGKAAKRLNHITVLDPVGAGASRFRTDTAIELLTEIQFDIIRGNASEIRAVAYGLDRLEGTADSEKSGGTRGVDADERDAVTEENLGEQVMFAKALSRRTHAIVVMTGAVDIAAAAEDAYIVRNGHPWLRRITGAGCMLDGLIAAFGVSNRDCLLEAVTAAVAAEGICGELAYKNVQETGGGTGSFRIALMDAVSNLEDRRWKERANIERL